MFTLIETWVLILTIGSHQHRGVGITTVPGYRVETECQQSARAWTDKDRMQIAYCIPGPKIRQ